MGREGAPTQPQGEGARHHTRQRDWHKGACGGRGGALWAVALTGRGAMGLDSRGGGTLTSPGWRGLAPPGPSHCAARPVKAGHLWSQADEASPSPGGGRGTSGPG